MTEPLKKKICLIGAYAVGKTSLVRQYVYSLFSDKYLSTVGVRIDKKELTVSGRDLDLIIWDLHGEDEFQTVRMSYLRGASGCIYVADGTRRATLDTALRLKQQVRDTIGPTPSILAVNKRDLETDWEIDSQTLDDLTATELFVLRTSAKSGQSVNTVFQKLAAMMLEVNT